MPVFVPGDIGGPATGVSALTASRRRSDAGAASPDCLYSGKSAVDRLSLGVARRTTVRASPTVTAGALAQLRSGAKFSGAGMFRAILAESSVAARAPRFHIPRASAQRQLRGGTRAAHSRKAVPLPAPRGAAPYRLDLAQVVGIKAITAIEAAGKLVFHAAGDTGGIKQPEFQENVAAAMERDFEALTPAPSFFYHLGDVVYFYGQRSLYYEQFYEPYMHYPRRSLRFRATTTAT